MSAAATHREHVTCPSCGWEWLYMPRPIPVPGYYQPVHHSCPNRHCRERHWIVVSKLSLTPVRWKVVRRVPCLGQDLAAMRRTLQQIPELDREAIDLFLLVHALKPDLEAL